MASEPGVMDRKRLMEEASHSGEMEGAYVSAEFRGYYRIHQGIHLHRGFDEADEVALESGSLIVL